MEPPSPGDPTPGPACDVPTADVWTCDRCGLPVVTGQSVYGLAKNEEARTTRHWACNTNLFDQLRASLHGR